MKAHNGQGLQEYGLIAAGVALVGISAFTVLGTNTADHLENGVSKEGMQSMAALLGGPPAATTTTATMQTGAPPPSAGTNPNDPSTDQGPGTPGPITNGNSGNNGTQPPPQPAPKSKQIGVRLPDGRKLVIGNSRFFSSPGQNTTSIDGASAITLLAGGLSGEIPGSAPLINRLKSLADRAMQFSKPDRNGNNYTGGPAELDPASAVPTSPKGERALSAAEVREMENDIARLMNLREQYSTQNPELAAELDNYITVLSAYHESAASSLAAGGDRTRVSENGAAF